MELVLGLCNFDTKRMEEIIGAGVKIATNQFSLIDSRPTYAMAEACEKHNIKLLTYGTLCGGFLSENWIRKDEPDSFGEEMTPSLRKCLRGSDSVGARFQLRAVLVGARMGVSDHAQDNLAAYGWQLDEEDKRMLEEVLCQSPRG
ncbi:hypothetical protein ACJ73_04524 [Blastomyces percursus]|uniref:NADP-dependent oxidoreductase domain-containing protein n=1 Tax=Blastomyces percursus TaxID=1658174 RepID=A0A1J9Q5V8_9EURO|nr:hypothetical protein ACJ73_04524 [Blastomyces percursus]